MLLGPQELHPHRNHELHMCRPLNYFASLYRSIQKDMMNMDQMLAMLDIDPGVKVRPSAGTASLSSSALNNAAFYQTKK